MLKNSFVPLAMAAFLASAGTGRRAGIPGRSW